MRDFRENLRANRFRGWFDSSCYSKLYCHSNDNEARNFISPCGRLTHLNKRIKIDDWHLPGQSEHTEKIALQRFNQMSRGSGLKLETFMAITALSTFEEYRSPASHVCAQIEEMKFLLSVRFGR